MQSTRRITQLAFLALTLVAVFALGANAEAWCPFGGVEAIYTYASEGNMLCSLGVSNFYILGGVLLSVLLLRRAFCSYACPIGAISQWLRAAAGWIGIPLVRVGPAADRVLAALKYVLLAVILYFTWRAGELVFRGFDPCYALISRHGADITRWAYVVAGAVAFASLLFMLPFCRWLCPLAAVLNPFSRFGLMRVQRDGDGCRDCGVCSRACPQAIPVGELPQVNAARCTSCFQCVDACPATKQKPLRWGPPRPRGAGWPPMAAVALLLICLGGAVAAAYVAPLPSFVKTEGVPPPEVAVVTLRVSDLGCRGRANMLVGFLGRDDLYGLPGPDGKPPGYFKLEAWPGPGWATIRVSYDAGRANEQTVKRAITEPYYDLATDRWWMSPFAIEGYDPLGE